MSTEHDKPPENNKNSTPALLTMQEVARLLRVSIRTIDNYLSKGLLPYAKLPGTRKRLIALEDILELLEKSKTHPQTTLENEERGDKPIAKENKKRQRRGRLSPAEISSTVSKVLGR